MTEPTTTDSIDLADQLVQDLRETYGAIWLFMPRVVALIERLRQTSTDLEIRNEQLANVQNRLTKERKEHEEQVGREIRVRNNVIAGLEEQVRSNPLLHRGRP